MGLDDGMSQEHWVIFLLTFVVTVWQPSGLYREMWFGGSHNIIFESWSRAARKAGYSVLPMWVFPSVWTIVNGFTWISWFLFFRSKDSLDNKYDILMGMIVASLALIKIWGLVNQHTAGLGRMAWSSFLLFASVVSTWGLMWAWLPNQERAPNPTSWVAWFWLPLVLWSAGLTVQGLMLFGSKVGDFNLEVSTVRAERQAMMNTRAA